MARRSCWEALQPQTQGPSTWGLFCSLRLLFRVPSRAPGSAAGSPVSTQVVGRGRGRKPQQHAPSSLEPWELKEDGEHLRAHSGENAAKASAASWHRLHVGRLTGEAWPVSALWPTAQSTLPPGRTGCPDCAFPSPASPKTVGPASALRPLGHLPVLEMAPPERPHPPLFLVRRAPPCLDPEGFTGLPHGPQPVAPWPGHSLQARRQLRPSLPPVVTCLYLQL